jgi:hypothetical protein
VQKKPCLSIHRPELFSGIELSEYDRSAIQIAIEVEHVVRSLFSGGVLVTGCLAQSQKSTAELLAQKTSTLFRAQFGQDLLIPAIDFLRFDNKSNEFPIMKSSLQPM